MYKMFAKKFDENHKILKFCKSSFFVDKTELIQRFVSVNH